MEELAHRFCLFGRAFAPFFRLCTRSVATQAEHYLCGLMQAARASKNMERMVEAVPESNWQSLQHFISNSPWSASAVMNQVASLTSELLGQGERGLLIDGSSVVKKGVKSVGVGRQWCGRLGKVENCQIGVFASLTRGIYSTLIAARLYLPKEWTQDSKRCEEAGIPEVHRVYKSESKLAEEIVREVRDLGISFGWVGLDGGFGKDPALLRALDDGGETFVADVHKSQHVYLEDPRPSVPAPRSTRGRHPSALVARTKSVRVDSWACEQPNKAWQIVEVRESTKGTIELEVLHQRVWLWDGKENQARCWHLVISRQIGSRKDIKYTLSNAPKETTAARLAYRQKQRFWVERSFQDGKSETGLADYQTRGWLAWHHHMALVMMAMLFMLGERLYQQPVNPLLSCSDIESLLAYILPRRATTVAEVLRQMKVRHEQRWASLCSAYRVQGRDPPNRETWGSAAMAGPS